MNAKQKPMTTLFSQLTCRWFILPSQALRDLLLRNYKQLYPWCNYILLYKDVNGFGIELSHAGWVPSGKTYIQS